MNIEQRIKESAVANAIIDTLEAMQDFANPEAIILSDIERSLEDYARSFTATHNGVRFLITVEVAA